MTSPIQTCWDDLLEDINNLDDWQVKRSVLKKQFLELIRQEAAPAIPDNFDIQREDSWEEDGYRVEYISYNVEDDERAHAYLAIPDGEIPEGGFPTVLCLHGTTNWGARRTLNYGPEEGDPHYNKEHSAEGKDYARLLVKNGFVTLSPEHFCSAARCPAEGPYETGPFYRKHPNWSAVGKYMHDSSIAVSVLQSLEQVNSERIGVTGHSLGGQGSIWLAAYDERIKCSAPSCAAGTFRENDQAHHWSRDYWYIYFPQLAQAIANKERIIPDFHEMMALIAPRPYFERLAFNDGDHLNQMHRVELHLRLHNIYQLYEQEEKHAFLVHGDGHAIPDISQDPLVAWMTRWLGDGDSLTQWRKTL